MSRRFLLPPLAALAAGFLATAGLHGQAKPGAPARVVRVFQAGDRVGTSVVLMTVSSNCVRLFE